MGMDLKANLQAMSNGGLGEWLDKMDQRWRCQQCGVPTVASNNNPRCLRCGTYQL
jgi:rubrerythrin